METEYIIIIQFNTKQDGLDYMSKSLHKFVFTDGTNFYDFYGNQIMLDVQYQTYHIDNISIQIHPKSLPGGLYVDNGYIKYFKEI